MTLPFFCSLAASVLLAVLIALLATDIERWLDVKGLAPLLTAASLSLPIGTATLFQEALYKRQMDFRVLALRTMVATAISGVVGIACAYAGFGALSLVIQVVVQSAVSGLWLWSQPRWLPMRGYDLKSLRELSGYSIHVVSNRLLDFAHRAYDRHDHPVALWRRGLGHLHGGRAGLHYPDAVADTGGHGRRAERTVQDRA
ncbi:O-antigen/teichoic acid export membrane protein [Bradyrhizobium sp. GM5.1]